MTEPKSMSAARRAYEEKQARKAGKSLDAWLAQKKRQQAQAKPSPTASAPKKPSLFSRLIERANKPL